MPGIRPPGIRDLTAPVGASGPDQKTLIKAGVAARAPRQEAPD